MCGPAPAVRPVPRTGSLCRPASHPPTASSRHTASRRRTASRRHTASPYGDPTTYGPGPYAAPGTYGAPQHNGSALALTITAGILSVLCCSLLTLPALILGIVGLSKQSTDPEGSARMTRYGWIAFGVGVLVSILAIIVLLRPRSRRLLRRLRPLRRLLTD